MHLLNREIMFQFVPKVRQYFNWGTEMKEMGDRWMLQMGNKMKEMDYEMDGRFKS